MTAPLRLAAACAALLLAGCSILGGPKEASTIYSPTPRMQADPAWPKVGWQLSTTRPTAARMLDSSRIAVIPTPGELQVYKQALWASTPPEMLEDSVLRVLEDSGKIPAVARQGSGIGADYRLVMDIRDFQADYAGTDAPSAVVEVSAKLLHAHDQSVVDSRVFRQTHAAASTDVAAVADAFGVALGQASHDIAGWALTAGQSHEARHPSGSD